MKPLKQLELLCALAFITLGANSSHGQMALQDLQGEWHNCADTMAYENVGMRFDTKKMRVDLDYYHHKKFTFDGTAVHISKRVLTARNGQLVEGPDVWVLDLKSCPAGIQAYDHHQAGDHSKLLGFLNGLNTVLASLPANQTAAAQAPVIQPLPPVITYSFCEAPVNSPQGTIFYHSSVFSYNFSDPDASTQVEAQFRNLLAQVYHTDAMVNCRLMDSAEEAQSELNKQIADWRENGATIKNTHYVWPVQ